MIRIPSALFAASATSLIFTSVSSYAAVDAPISNSVNEIQSTSDGVPRCIGAHEPEYPFILRRTGNRGLVVLRFLVDRTGKVVEADVPVSTHPAFERSAITWLFDCTCSPPTLNGVPAPRRVRQLVNFVLKGRAIGPESPGLETFAIPSKASSELPPEFQYDNPPKLQYIAPLVYPLRLLKESTSGSAKVRFTVSPDGRVRDVTVLDSSYPELGLALKANMEAWRFVPAKKSAKPSPSMFVREQKFNANDREAWTDRPTDDLLDRIRSDDAGLPQLGDLDALPKALYRPAPIYPPDLESSALEGKAVIEFYIGADGQARLPKVMSADNPQFGWAAATAVARWRYAPPLIHGKPVEVLARVPVEFKLPHPQDPAPLPVRSSAGAEPVLRP